MSGSWDNKYNKGVKNGRNITVLYMLLNVQLREMK